MTINDTLNIYNNITDDEILGTFWYIDIVDNDSNNVKIGDYGLGEGIADKYIHSVDIPSTEIKYEKTSWGQINAEDFEVQEDFSITFSSSITANILNFTEDWLNSIFDRDKFRFKSDYRNQGKTFRIVIFRPYNSRSNRLRDNIFSSTFANAIGYVNAVTDTVNKFKTLIGKGSTIVNNNNADNIAISSVYEMENVYPIKLDDVSFSDDDSDRKIFTLSCECAKINKLYGDRAKGVINA